MTEATSSPAPAATPAAPAATPPAAPAPAPNPADGQQQPAAAPGTPTPAPSTTPGAPPPPPPVEAKPEGAPEAYADFTLPEGVTLVPQTLEKFKATARELNLSQDAAQKLVTLQAQEQAAQAQAVLADWSTKAKADQEFGGEKFDENLAVAKKALEKFGTPEFNEWLLKTGLGSHPEMIRTFFRAGKAISEDGFVPGRAGQQGGDSIAQRMFPTMNP